MSLQVQLSEPATTRSGFRKPPLMSARRTEQAQSPEVPGEHSAPIDLLRRLFFLYFALLIVEGALRKWLLPQLSAPLLIVRDPVALAICVLAFKQRIIPGDRLFRFFIFQAVAGIFLAGAQFVLNAVPPFVLAYGYRTLFLHLPLVFVLPRVFTHRDVTRLGFWMLILALPMAALMAYQFNSPADAWVNRTAGMSNTTQLASAMGKIRPPGTFSFISGPVAYFSLVTAFVGYGLIARARLFPKWLLAAAAISVGLAVAVSGSRATILSSGIVVAVWALGTAAGKRISNAIGNSIVVVLIAVFVLGQIDLVQEGRAVLNERFELGHEMEQEQGGLAGRFLGDIIAPWRMFLDLPFFGVGLGLGTNVGSTLVTGKRQFLYSEGEWGRNLLEMGPLFGALFIALRVALTIYLGRESLRAAHQGYLLPLLLFSACAVNVFSGQISQPTTLGFTVLGAGLCWAALTHPPEIETEQATPDEPLRFARDRG